MEHTAAKIEKKYQMRGPGTEDEIDLNSKIRKPVFNELDYLKKLEKSKTG